MPHFMGITKSNFNIVFSDFVTPDEAFRLLSLPLLMGIACLPSKNIFTLLIHTLLSVPIRKIYVCASLSVELDGDDTALLTIITL